MSDRIFLDTNIFIYSFDKKDSKKQNKAIQIIKSSIEKNQASISFQVVQEFLNVSLSKFKTPLKIFEAEKYLNDILWPLCTVFPDQSLYSDAMVVKESLKISFYDSLIISAAIFAGCNVLYSEDLQAGRKYRGLEIVNPF